jgi:PAS domain S-box-containing protein
VCAITGYSHEELSAKTFADITHPDDIEGDWDLARRVASGEIPTYSMEKRYVRKNGFTVWVNLTVSLLTDRNGAPQYFISIIQDVTARKQAEEKFHLAVQAAPNGMVVANAEGEIVLVNSYTEKLFGYSRDELIGKPIELLVPERFRVSHEKDRYGFLREPQARSMGAGRDLYGRRKDGTEFPVEIGLNPIQTDREMLVLGSILDISERRESEATRRLLASVVESSVDGMISKDLNGIVTSWNGGAERMFGYAVAEMIGQTISAIIPAGHVDETPAMLDRVKRGEPVEQYEAVRRAKNGNLLIVSITWSPIHDARGRIAGAAKVVRDITERKQAEQQRLELRARERALVSERALREREAELARVLRALSLGELATSIAHEVNQPLAGVVTNAEAGLRWLGGDPPNLEEARESLTMIAEDGTRAGEVIRRLREFLKKSTAESTLLEINEVVREAIALARAELLKRQVEVRIELSDGLPLVRGDRIQLQQVLLNLIMNGAEAMAAITAPKELVLTSQRPAEDRVLVTVRDGGSGIGAQDMPRMFDAFFTTKSTGMGMGLSISRSILEAHGGRIWAEANEGSGLTVQFSLPVETAGEKSAAAGDGS